MKKSFIATIFIAAIQLSVSAAPDIAPIIPQAGTVNNQSLEMLRQHQIERQIQEAKGLLEEKHKKQIAELNARTRANEEETLGYTMHSEDLRAQLEELRAQLNSGTMRR